MRLGLDPGDYEETFHLRRALSAKLTQQSIDDRSAAATQHSEGTVTSAALSEYQAPQALASVTLETGTTFSSLTVERESETLRTFPRLLRDVEGAAQLFMATSEATRVPFLEAILCGEDSDVVFAVSRSLGVNLSLSALASSGALLAAIPAPTSTARATASGHFLPSGGGRCKANMPLPVIKFAIPVVSNPPCEGKKGSSRHVWEALEKTSNRCLSSSCIL